LTGDVPPPRIVRGVHGTIAVENPFGCKQSFASSAKEVDVAVTCSNQGPSTSGLKMLGDPQSGGDSEKLSDGGVVVGLALVHSEHARFASIDVDTGNLTLLGPSLKTVAVSMGGLRAVDRKRNTYYFLGESFISQAQKVT
jgi:hypothetical protein